MKSIVGLIFAVAYFMLVIALLVAREFVTGYTAWQSVDTALSLLTIPWSILVFVFAMPVLDAPEAGKQANLAIHAIGGLVNATIIYTVCAFTSYWLRKQSALRVPHSNNPPRV